MRRIDLFAFVLLPVATAAQTPACRALVDPVTVPGYHSIVLSPELVGRSAPDLRDLRIIDDHGTEVPYVLEQEPMVRESVRQVPFNLVRNEIVPGKETIVEIDAGTGSLVDELHLSIRNARVTKEIRVTGSDDGRRWFMLRDLRLDLAGERSRERTELRIVDMPVSHYRYYRIVLNDSLTAPVQVLEVGHTGRVREEGRYVQLNDLRWRQHDEKGRSVLHLTAPYPLVVERISYATADLGPFQRSGRIEAQHMMETRHGRRQRKIREEVGTQVLDQVLLTSYNGDRIDGLRIREDSFQVVVINGDDAPLRFSSVSAWQLERRIIAPLDPEHTYWITTGAKDLNAPQYDLVHFRDSIGTQITPLGTGPIQGSNARTRPDDPGSQAYWVWIGIALLMALMGWSASRMLRQRA